MEIKFELFHFNYNEPSDFEIVWKRWNKEIDELETNIEIIKKIKIDDIKIIDFIYIAVDKSKIHGKYYCPKEMKPCLILGYHGYYGYVDDIYQQEYSMTLAKIGVSSVYIDMPLQGGKSVVSSNYENIEYGLQVGNILDMENNYIKHCYFDAIQLFNIVKNNPLFSVHKNHQIITHGSSQGGMLALVVACQKEVDICIPEIPSGCLIEERIKNKEGMYQEISHYLEKHPENKSIVLKNISYFDLIYMSPNIKAKVYASVGLEDRVCPPQYFYEVFKKINTFKKLYIYPGFGHGGFEELFFPIKKEILLNCKKNK